MTLRSRYLTQAREHIIRRTFEACAGRASRESYMYTILLLLHRESKYSKKSKEEIKQIAVDGAKLLKKLAKEVDR